jgi:class 3 adenylate cyclase
LEAEGFETVYVLAGGLDAWTDAGFQQLPIETDELPCVECPDDALPERMETQSTSDDRARHRHAFLPGLVETYANRQELPVKRRLAVLFVDIADSTPQIIGREPEEALAFVQRFMGYVTQAALDYCGDVKDYEGDGALLYFESVSESVQAAFAIRDSLLNGRDADDALRARLSLDAGDVVIGVIGTALRRSVALIGPCINVAARMLKQIPPDGIIATGSVVQSLQAEHPALAERFSLFDEHLELKGFERQVVSAWVASPAD